MSNSVSVYNIALESIFGLAAVFCFFAPKLLGWSGWSYIGGIFFVILAILVIVIKRS